MAMQQVFLAAIDRAAAHQRWSLRGVTLYNSGLQIIDFMKTGYIKACSAASTTRPLLGYIPVINTSLQTREKEPERDYVGK